MKNVIFCGHKSCYFVIAFLSLNLILGVMFYSSDKKIKLGYSVLNANLHVRDAMNKGSLLNNVSMIDYKQSQSSSLTHSFGYVLPYSVYEQQTSSARNLWGLQFWANTVSMKVVEPFFVAHSLSFEPVVMGMPNPMRFGDMYDIDYWNKQSTKRNCSELVGWEDFLSNAPKQIILVLNRGFKSNSKSAANAGEVEILNNPDAIVGKRSCGDSKHSDIEFSEKALRYFEQNGFHFVREVCITFNASRPMAVEEFSHHILGELRSNQVTVIFAFWQGIRSNRVNLKGITLKNEDTVEIGLMPSRKIVKESDRYLHGLKLGSNKYFGVMIRVEKVFINSIIHKRSGTFNSFVDYMLECANDLKHLKQFNVHKKWGRTLAIDLGRFGSVGFTRHGKEAHRGAQQLYEAYFSSVFGEEGWTTEEYENSFKEYLGTENPVHIAQIQRTIAARSDCLILVGGGSTFQSVAISFYKNFHPDTKQQCIIKLCFYGYNYNFKAFVNKQALNIT